MTSSINITFPIESSSINKSTIKCFRLSRIIATYYKLRFVGLFFETGENLLQNGIKFLFLVLKSIVRNYVEHAT